MHGHGEVPKKGIRVHRGGRGAEMCPVTERDEVPSEVEDKFAGWAVMGGRDAWERPTFAAVSPGIDSANTR